MLPKVKLRGIRKAILEELGVEDICTVRIFSTEPLKPEEKPAKEEEDAEKKESEAEEEDQALLI